MHCLVGPYLFVDSTGRQSITFGTDVECSQHGLCMDRMQVCPNSMGCRVHVGHHEDLLCHPVDRGNKQLHASHRETGSLPSY